MQAKFQDIVRKINVNPEVFGKNMSAWYADVEKAK